MLLAACFNPLSCGQVNQTKVETAIALSDLRFNPLSCGQVNQTRPLRSCRPFGFNPLSCGQVNQTIVGFLWLFLTGFNPLSCGQVNQTVPQELQSYKYFFIDQAQGGAQLEGRV